MIITRQKRWLDQPSGGYTINWGHPLTLGLKSLLLFNHPGGMGSATASPILWDGVQNAFGEGTAAGLVNTSGSAAWVSGLPGNGVKFAGVSDYANVGIASDLLPTDRVTILVIRRKTDSTLRASALFGLNGPSAEANANRCGCHGPWSDGTIYFDFGGQTGANRLIIAGQSWNTSVDRMAFRAGGLGSAVWRNGTKIGSQSTAITRSALVARFAFNQGNGGTTGDLQEVYYFGVSAAEWDDSMVNWWMNEPYAMLLPQAVRRYFVPKLAVAASPRPRISIMT